MIRRIIEIMKADGVMPPYGMMVTPEEYDYLTKKVSRKPKKVTKR